MDRYWLLTWTTYGTWLPGDERGFVTEIRDNDGRKVIHNVPGTPCDADISPIKGYAASIMTGEAVWLDVPQAQAVAEQLRETATYRGWELVALAVMANHVHVLVGVPGDPDPEKRLGDFKAWATRRLNAGWGRRAHWWTQSGSRRRKQTGDAVNEAIHYVRDQPYALVVWLSDSASGAASARR